MYVIETYFIKDLVNIIDQRIGKVKKVMTTKKCWKKRNIGQRHRSVCQMFTGMHAISRVVLILKSLQ